MQNEQPPPEKPADKGGRPPHAPTELTKNVVRMCIGFGIPQEEICLALNIKNRGTLRKHYKREIKAGKAQTKVQMVSNLLALSNLKNATGLKATIFALTCQFGWSQYSGPPPEEIEAPKGKKQQQLDDAHDDAGSSWGEINRLPTTRLPN